MTLPDALPPALPAPRLLSHSGGLVYHLRALAYRRRQWRDFRASVAGWIAGWQPSARALVLVGPSGGYTLPDALFARFDEIVALEPDPLARRMLARRAPAGRLRFDDLDVLGSAGALALLPARHRGAAVLFCNVLGQLEAPAGEPWAAHCAAHLAAVEWASYHDVISTESAPARRGPRAAVTETRLEAVLALFWDGGELALTDHRTFCLAGPAPRDYALWPLLPGRQHLIEWVSHAPSAGRG